VRLSKEGLFFHIIGDIAKVTKGELGNKVSIKKEKEKELLELCSNESRRWSGARGNIHETREAGSCLLFREVLQENKKTYL
jgi:hypothetical protein